MRGPEDTEEMKTTQGSSKSCKMRNSMKSLKYLKLTEESPKQKTEMKEILIRGKGMMKQAEMGEGKNLTKAYCF